MSLPASMAGMRHATRHSRLRGFTLVEQMTALAVAAVMVAMAIPAMAGLLDGSAVHATGDALFTAAHLARASAIDDNTHALLCPSLDGQHCANQPKWQHGWIVALDKDHDGQPDGPVLASHVPGDHVRVVGSAGRGHVRFRPDGDAAGTNLSLVVCPPPGHGTSAMVVVVSNAGRVREDVANARYQARCKVHG